MQSGNKKSALFALDMEGDGFLDSGRGHLGRGDFGGGSNPRLEELGWGNDVGFLAIHACGKATDRCLDIAMVSGQV